MSTIQATAVRGASWTIIGGFATRILSLVASVVITHYVDPTSLGDVGAAGIFVQTANSVSTLGMGQYVIAKKDIDREETFHITILNFLAVAIAVTLAMAIRVPLGKFLNVTDSARYLPWFMATFVLDRASFIPERLLIRRLEFRRIAFARSSSELASGISAIVFAMLGWGGYALVVASAVRSVIKAGVFLSGVRAPDWLAPAKLHLASYRRILHFGLPIAGQGLLLNAASRWDNLVFS
jgi:lipopolysaccharide exporter